jgi:hypothetical protein
MRQSLPRLLKIVIPLLIVIGCTACRSATTSVTATPSPECAAQNQDEFDRAVHRIIQPRELVMRVNVAGMGAEPLYMCNHQYFGDMNNDNCQQLNFGPTGKSLIPVRYEASHIGVFLYGLPSETGLSEVEISWFHPGENYEQLSVALDANAFSFEAGDPDEEGIVRFTYTYPIDWQPSHFFISFGSLLGLDISEENAFSLAGSDVDFVHVVSMFPGESTFDLNMTAFLQWSKNSWAPPFRAGDNFAVNASVEFNQPAGTFEAIPSNEVDPPYVPTPYTCVRDGQDGTDPNFNVPGIEPYERVTLRGTIDVPVTDTMVGDTSPLAP